MKRSRMLPIVGIALLAAATAALAWRSLQPADVPPRHQGWVEAYFIYISPDEPGRIDKLDVREGSKVEKGSPLYALDSDLQRAAVAEAEAALENARITFDRAKELLKKNVGSQKTFDDAEASLRTAQARLNSANTRLERRRMSSPVSGTVQEIYFRTGEMAQAGRPVLSLLPPDNTRVRFFVPQAAVPRYRIGDPVSVSCDGCAGDISANVSFISAQAEFTPPVIYSQEERSRLVFRIEAIPQSPERLRVGQPVTVRRIASGAVADGPR